MTVYVESAEKGRNREDYEWRGTYKDSNLAHLQLLLAISLPGPFRAIFVVLPCAQPHVERTPGQSAQAVFHQKTSNSSIFVQPNAPIIDADCFCFLLAIFSSRSPNWGKELSITQQ